MNNIPTYFKVFLASILSKLLILFFGKHVIKKINGIKFKLDLTEGIDLRLFLNFLEEKKLYQNLGKILDLEKKYIFIDVGANIGSVSLSLAKKFKNSIILAIEPTFYAFNKLKGNLNLNTSLKKRIKLMNLFLTSKKIKKNFAYSSWKLDFNKNSHPIHKGLLKKVSNSQRTLDYIVKKYKRVDFIKIDTDGNEFYVLSSGLNQIRKFKPIIHMELAPYLYKENGYTAKKLISLIKNKMNYKFYNEEIENIKDIRKFISGIGNSSENIFIIHSKFDFNTKNR